MRPREISPAFSALAANPSAYTIHTVYSYVRYGAAHGYAPEYITNGYTDISYVVPVTSSLFDIPRTRTRMGDRALLVAGSRAWNALPAVIRCAPSLDTFKKHLKSHLFTASYDL